MFGLGTKACRNPLHRTNFWIFDKKTNAFLCHSFGNLREVWSIDQIHTMNDKRTAWKWLNVANNIWHSLLQHQGRKMKNKNDGAKLKRIKKGYTLLLVTVSTPQGCRSGNLSAGKNVNFEIYNTVATLNLNERVFLIENFSLFCFVTSQWRQNLHKNLQKFLQR